MIPWNTSSAYWSKTKCGAILASFDKKVFYAVKKCMKDLLKRWTAITYYISSLLLSSECLIYFFIVIFHIIIWIPFIIGQKCIIFTFIFTEYSLSSPEFFCLLLFIIWIFVKTITFFVTNITIPFPWFTTIVIIIIAIISITAFVVLIFAVILPKSTIYKILNIGSIAIIMSHDWWSKLGNFFFKDCYRNK